MMISEELMNFFPHDTIREGQKDLVIDMDAAFTEGKILVAHAPTGLGKTASALSVAMKHAIESGKRVFFLTNRHTQHQIAIQTLRMIQDKLDTKINCVDLVGKRWMCGQNISGIFGTDFQEFCKTIVERGECEYYNKIRAKKGLTVEGKAALSDVKLQGPLHTEELIAFGHQNSM